MLSFLFECLILFLNLIHSTSLHYVAIRVYFLRIDFLMEKESRHP